MRENRDTSGPPIRPRDPKVIGLTTMHMRVPPHDVIRRLIQVAFRDAHTVIDLTYAHGNFWREPLPPGIALTTNSLDPRAATDLHVDFTATGLPDGAHDVAIIDPPHNPDAGAASFMGRRYGTLKGTAELRELIEAGCREAWRIARLGVIVKVCDQNHGSRYVEQSEWVRHAIPTPPYTKLEQLGGPTMGRGRRKLHRRVPYADGAVYLVFRRGSPAHRDWDAEYLRQERLRCPGCNGLLLDKRRQATTCSDACRARAYRRRRSAALRERQRAD